MKQTNHNNICLYNQTIAQYNNNYYNNKLIIVVRRTVYQQWTCHSSIILINSLHNCKYYLCIHKYEAVIWQPKKSC